MVSFKVKQLDGFAAVGALVVALFHPVFEALIMKVVPTVTLQLCHHIRSLVVLQTYHTLTFMLKLLRVIGHFGQRLQDLWDLTISKLAGIGLLILSPSHVHKDKWQ